MRRRFHGRIPPPHFQNHGEMMAQFESDVLTNLVVPPGLPDWAGQYIVMAEWLRCGGKTEQVDERLPVNRGSGYVGIDGLMFLLGYFTSGKRCGLKRFAGATIGWGPQLAALMDRLRWPTQSSISRLLACLEMEDVKRFASWLLADVSGKLPARSEYVCQRDTFGQEWHTFHWDPTVITLRSRGLPHGEGLPDARRRSEGIAAPGYSGRKRGEMQVTRSTVQHAGSGLWVTSGLEPGNGNLVEQLREALVGIEKFAGVNDIGLDRCICCADGVGGGRSQVREFQNSQVHMVTRLSDYQLLDKPVVWEKLKDARWQDVEDSGSGPKRYATELGSVSFNGATAVRLVVSRFELKEGTAKRGAGVVHDGWQYEIFATDLDDSAFPASEVVTLYYARCGVENQFACENRELRTNRLHSYNPAGQLLATAVALFVWNMQLQLGGKIATKAPLVQIKTSPRQIGDMVLEPPSIEQDHNVAPRDDDRVEWSSASYLSNPELSAQALDALDWNQRLDGYSGWTWNLSQGGLTCPSGQCLGLRRVRLFKSGTISLRFRGTKRWCPACPKRSKCSSSTVRDFRKELSFNLSQKETAQVYQIQGTSPPSADISVASSRWEPPRVAKPGPYQMGAPPLLPTELRRLFTEPCQKVRAEVAIINPLQQPKLPPYLALTPARRQRRRKTWAERRAWNALPAETRVRLTVRAPQGIAALLSPRQLAVKEAMC